MRSIDIPKLSSKHHNHPLWECKMLCVCVCVMCFPSKQKKKKVLHQASACVWVGLIKLQLLPKCWIHFGSCVCMFVSSSFQAKKSNIGVGSIFWYLFSPLSSKNPTLGVCACVMNLLGSTYYQNIGSILVVAWV